MARKRFTDKDRARIFAANNGCCHLCGFKIDGVREAWEVEHVIALELTRDDSDANLRPAHKSCHSTKTHTQDRPAINEAKRREAKHFGVKRPKASIPSRPKEHRPARDRLPMPGRAQDIFGKPISKEAQTP
jgi:5-methylcytosine-specific restriction protein A